MDIFDFISNSDIIELSDRRKIVDRRKLIAGYNLFSVSTYTSHLENFHSDVIASLLNPTGPHNEGRRFLDLFIDYLNTFYDRNINKHNYTNPKIFRERGRIDIWISDQSSRHSIIFENKINDAYDRDNQIEDYHQYLLDNNYTVDILIYLSKDGNKLAPINDVHIQQKIVNIAAFNDTSKDLLNGWLMPCIYSVTANKDTESFLLQYSKLLTHLSNKMMENNLQSDFYKFVMS